MSAAAIHATPPSPTRRALRTEVQATAAMPVARMLLGGSVVMAVLSCAGNLAALDSLAGDEPPRLALHAATVPALVFALVAGVYSASTDRRFGFIDQRLLTDTSRSRWLTAKVAVQAAVGFGYGLLGAVVAIATSMTVFAIRGESFDATSVVVARSLLGVILATPMFAVLGTALGSMTGNTSALVAAVLVWMLVIEPPAVIGAPEAARWLPGASGLALTYSPDEALLGQIAGGAVLAAFTALALVVARRRIENADV